MLAIGEAARRSGVDIETIRFYERKGIVTPPPRASNGRRLYSEQAVARLAFIRRCRDLGFPLADVRELLALSQDSEANCAAVRNLAARHLKDVRSKIAELQRLEAALDELTANCAAGSLRCPLLDRLRSEPCGSPGKP
jgi:MerR family mercuric resistance operon transcriptional regulator